MLKNHRNTNINFQPPAYYFHPDPQSSHSQVIFLVFFLWTFSGRDLRLSDWNCLFWHQAAAWNGQNWKQQQRKCKGGKWWENTMFRLKDETCLKCDSISNNLTLSVHDRFILVFMRQNFNFSTLKIAIAIASPTYPSLFQTHQQFPFFLLLFVAISTIAAEVQIGGSFAVFTGNVVEGIAGPGFCVSITISFWERKSFGFERVEKKKKRPNFLQMMIIFLDITSRMGEKGFWESDRIIHSIETPWEGLSISGTRRENVKKVLNVFDDQDIFQD